MTHASTLTWEDTYDDDEGTEGVLGVAPDVELHVAATPRGTVANWTMGRGEKWVAYRLAVGLA